MIHRVMEHLDLSRAPEELEPEISALAAAFGRMDGLREATIAKCGDIARRLIAHPIVAAARAAPERWQEVPFAFKEAKRIVSGTIDLCFPRDAERKRWVVVDWKSTLPPEGSERRARYERQIALYGKALLANLGGATGGGEIEVETVLVGPHPELEPERVEETLASVNADLRPGLEALLQAGAPAPTAGADAGEPVIATLELAWEAHKIGLLLDATDEQARALGADGWRIAREDTSVDGWAERAIAALAESLGVALPATPASSDSEDGDGDDGPEDAPR